MGDEFPRCTFDGDKLVLQLDLTFPAEPHRIPALVADIMRLVHETPCGAENTGGLELALTEALANAVVHGARRDPERSVQCCVACDAEHGLLVVVRDPGAGFDVHSLASPLRGKQLWSSGGRGIFLINQLMDRVEFRAGGTEIHMQKKPS